MDLLLLFFRIPVWILSAFVMLLYNAQHMVLIFGGCYTTLVMLTNLDSWKDLLGKLFQYLAAILAILVFTCLPITRVCRDVQTDLIILAAGLLLLVISALRDGPAFSPVRNTFHLLGTILENLDRTRVLQKREVRKTQSSSAGRRSRTSANGRTRFLRIPTSS